jgi:integrase
MSRTRRRINAALPKFVYRRTYGFIYRPYLGMENGARKYGKEVNLCPTDSTVAQVYEAYERETRQENNTLRWLLSEYHASPKFKALKPRTREDYEGYRSILLAYPMANGKPFGGALLVKIKRTAIQKYLDKYHAPISANRQVQYLKAAWNWALNRYEHVPENPCVGVELNKQEARTRYVTQAEFAAFKATTTGYIPLFMELAYLCRGRWGEVSKLKKSDILPEGLRLSRSKGSEGEITAITPRLKAALEMCAAYNPKAPSPIGGVFLIHNKRGLPIRQNAFQTAWGRAMRDWVAQGGERFTYHDLKASGYSDQKRQDAGHRSDKMHRTYSRKLRIVEPPE